MSNPLSDATTNIARFGSDFHTAVKTELKPSTWIGRAVLWFDRVLCKGGFVKARIEVRLQDIFKNTYGSKNTLAPSVLRNIKDMNMRKLSPTEALDKIMLVSCTRMPKSDLSEKQVKDFLKSEEAKEVAEKSAAKAEKEGLQKQAKLAALKSKPPPQQNSSDTQSSSGPAYRPLSTGMSYRGGNRNQ